jgi:hypothetical protein
MKDQIILFIVITILSLAVYNAWKDEEEMHSHEEFFEQMLEFKHSLEVFKNKGRRNTADQGQALCERLNTLETESGKPEIDCEALYQ